MNRRLPLRLQKIGTGLLHPQCWLWGQDVRRAEGNLLLQHGFERVRPPRSVTGCTQYTLRLEDGLHLRVWGFGLFIGREEGVYLNRFTFTPGRVRLDEDVWEAGHFKRLLPSTDLDLVARAIRCIACYENSLQGSVGPDYRASCMARWEKPGLTAQRLIQGWKSLESGIQQCGLSHPAALQGPKPQAFDLALRPA